MAANAPAHVVLLPWVRQGAASAIAVADALGPQDGAVTLAASLAVNGGEPVRMDVRLLGPSDVVGISPRDIVRREPPPGTTDFESNHFVAIEFDRPDFPWLFTPAKAAENARLRPWLCLVVVRTQEGVTLHPGVSRPLPSIEIASAIATQELPDLGESWWWAHAQAAGAAGTEVDALRSTLAGDPAASLSRLLCPRYLAPDTEYTACLVPAFEPGRKAGLGLPVDSAEPIAPAWTPESIARGPVELPLYDHWTFRTGAGGDFRTLAKLLHAEPAPAGLGRRPIRIGEPGFLLPQEFPRDATLQLEGALQAIRAQGGSGWPDGTMAPFQEALATIVNAQASTPSNDPLLAPPLYGRWHAGREAARRTGPGLTWFDELNLDPRHRAVAALGTRVVQEHQEALMASAWQQAGDVEAANQRMRQLQLGLAIGHSLHTRHFSRMEPDALLRVAAPSLSRVRVAPVQGAPGAQAATMVTAFVSTALPLNSMAPAMRKLARARGPINRRVARVAQLGAGLRGFGARVNEATAIFTAAPLPAMATFDTVRQQSASLASVTSYPQATRDAVAAMPGAPQFRIVAEGTPIPMPLDDANLPPQDNAVASAFRAAAVAHLEKLAPQRPWISVLRVHRALDLDGLRAQLQAQMRPTPRIAALASLLVPRRAGVTLANEEAPVSTVMVAPRFPQPMYEALRDLSQELLLPGLEAVTPNCVLGLRTNQRFVNAYMVGLNFEMGRELLWRGFPTDQRGTWFDQFWDPAGSDRPHRDLDPPLGQWGARPLAGPPGEAPGRFVMLLRSELLRRYPTAAIYAAPAVMVDGKRAPDPVSEHEEHPVFRGSLPPDVTFVGFDLTARQVVGDGGSAGYFVVIQEQPTEPRFGLDAEFVVPGSTHLLASAEPPQGLDLRGLQWRQNAAHMAGILRRRPVRIAIHASQFVSPQDLVEET